MILAPILLSFVYEWNQEATFFVTASVFAIALIAMISVRTWKNAKDIGKIPLWKMDNRSGDVSEEIGIEMVDNTNKEEGIEKQLRGLE